MISSNAHRFVKCDIGVWLNKNVSVYFTEMHVACLLELEERMINYFNNTNEKIIAGPSAMFNSQD